MPDEHSSAGKSSIFSQAPVLADVDETVEESFTADRSRVIPTASDAPEVQAEAGVSESDAAFLQQADKLLAMDACDIVDEVE